MSAPALAKRLGVPRTRIERLVKGETSLSVDYRRSLIGTHDGFGARRPNGPPSTGSSSCPDLFRASFSTVSTGPGGRMDTRNKSGHDEKKA